MTVALCFSGHLRSYKNAYASIKKNIIDVCNPDVYIHCWDKEGYDGVRGDALSINRPVDIDWLQEYYKPVTLCIEPMPYWQHNFVVKPNIGLRHPQIPMGIFYGIYKANSLLSQPYDIVIRCRPDLMLYHSIDLATCQDGIAFPAFGKYGGLADQFFFGRSDKMKLMCSTYTILHTLYNNGCDFHAESLVKATCDYYKLPVYFSNIKYDLLRTDGSIFKLA